MDSYLFEDEPVDPEIKKLVALEDARQADRLQMIPSESICPAPVLAALSTSFANKYAEGYPSRRMSRRERKHFGLERTEHDLQITHVLNRRVMSLILALVFHYT